MNTHTAFQIIASAFIALALWLAALTSAQAQSVPAGCRRIPGGISCPSQSGSMYRSITCNPGYRFQVRQSPVTGRFLGVCER